MSAEKSAGEFFDEGHSCTRAVLQATSGSTNQELLAATAFFICGIGKSGCLCGAITGGITGGIMALGRPDVRLQGSL